MERHNSRQRRMRCGVERAERGPCARGRGPEAARLARIRTLVFPAACRQTLSLRQPLCTFLPPVDGSNPALFDLAAAQPCLTRPHHALFLINTPHQPVLQRGTLEDMAALGIAELVASAGNLSTNVLNCGRLCHVFDGFFAFSSVFPTFPLTPLFCACAIYIPAITLEVIGLHLECIPCIGPYI